MTKKEDPGAGININYYGGEICDINDKQIPRETTIVLKCDRTIQNYTQVKVTEPEPCHYQISFSSKYACPDGREGEFEGGWIFVIIVLVGLALYFIIGIIIKIAVFKASGKDIIPNTEFWVELPGLIKDGIVFLFNKITCRGGSYSKV